MTGHCCQRGKKPRSGTRHHFKIFPFSERSVLLAATRTIHSVLDRIGFVLILSYLVTLVLGHFGTYHFHRGLNPTVAHAIFFSMGTTFPSFLRVISPIVWGLKPSFFMVLGPRDGCLIKGILQQEPQCGLRN